MSEFLIAVQWTCLCVVVFFCLGVHSLLFPKLLWWWQWWDYEVSVFSFSTASPHGLLPPLSFYSLLLGDASLSPNVTQAKTPLSSVARAYYPGNTAIPPLLFYTHLLSSLILPTSSPPLHHRSPACAGHRICFWNAGMTVRCESCAALGFNYDKFNSYVFLSYYSHLPHSILAFLFCSGKNVDLCIISQQLSHMITKCSLVCMLLGRKLL